MTVLRIWHRLLDIVGERFEDRCYAGDGNCVSRRGWRVGRRTFWYDENYS